MNLPLKWGYLRELRISVEREDKLNNCDTEIRLQGAIKDHLEGFVSSQICCIFIPNFRQKIIEKLYEMMMFWFSDTTDYTNNLYTTAAPEKISHKWKNIIFKYNVAATTTKKRFVHYLTT